ncbi:MAG: hypothetical protein HRT90_10600, partial [Candidatus Margulisbacteria bacterium]|nr:hypothetical protein [Candidatus Margulisiibacteriota bacterium]
YSKIEALLPKLSGIYYQLLIQKSQARTARMLETIQDIQKRFMGLGIPAREAGNYAIPVSGLIAVNPDPKFVDWVLESLLDEVEQSKSNSTILQFLEDVYHMQIKGTLNNEYIKVKEDFIFLWLRGIYSIWSEPFVRTERGIIPCESLLGLFKEETYYHSHNQSKRMGEDNTNRKCLVLNLKNSPEVLAAIAEKSEILRKNKRFYT